MEGLQDRSEVLRCEAQENRGRVRPPKFGGAGLCPRKIFEILHANLYILVHIGVVCLRQQYHGKILEGLKLKFWTGENLMALPRL